MFGEEAVPLSCRNPWTVGEKLRIVEEAILAREDKENDETVADVARKNGVDASLLRKWIKMEEDLRNMKEKVGSRRFRSSGGGRKVFMSEEAEKRIVEFVNDRRKRTLAVDVNMMMLEFKKSFPVEAQGLSDGAIRQRMYRVMKRHAFCFRRVTHQAQSNRNCGKTMKDWVIYIKQKQLMAGIVPSHVANFDQTNIYFSPQVNYTIASRGDKTVSMRSPASNNRCTVMLGCTEDGHLLNPYIVFKGVSTRGGKILKEIATPALARANGYPDEILYSVQHKAWMDTNQMLQWVSAVWKPFADSKEGPTMLIIDEHPAHLVSEFRQAVAACGTFLEFVPRGYTSKLQVMDVGLNKPFKDRIREQVNLFMLVNQSNDKPSRQTVAKWVKDSWYAIPSSFVTNTWKKIFKN